MWALFLAVGLVPAALAAIDDYKTGFSFPCPTRP